MTTKKSYLLLLFALGINLLLITCKKNIDTTSQNQQQGQMVDLTEKATAALSGFVSNDSNIPVQGANVHYGNISAVTDQYGYFKIINATVTKNAAFVTVEMPGYFKGIKTFIAEENKENFCRIKLIPKTISGSVNSSTGGNIVLPNGLNIAIPSNAVMDAATKTIYNGTVNAAMFWIDPLGPEIDKLMPGDLRGLNEAGLMNGLISYGMSAVELTGNAGELLQIAEGKKVSLTMPLPTSISADAPSTIPLWYFDETNGLWKEEGFATKSGNNYTGEVSHFSYWNCDIPVPNRVGFNCTITDSLGNPLSGIQVSIRMTGNTVGTAHGCTNTDGYISGEIPANTALLLEIFDDGNCVVYSQNLTTGSSFYSLGNIKMPGNNIVTITGTVTDCNFNPLTNGYIILKKGYTNYFYGLTGNSFNIPVTNACASINISIVAVNTGTGEESPVNTYSIGHQNIMLPNITACGQQTTEYCNLTINNESYILGPYTGGNLANDCGYAGDRTGFNTTLLKLINGVYVRNDDHIQWAIYHGYSTPPPCDTNYLCYFNLYRGADSAYSVVLPLLTIGTMQNPYTYSTSHVNIINYGPTGQYVTGSFNGVLYREMNYANLDTAHPYHVSLNFRAKRSQ